MTTLGELFRKYHYTMNPVTRAVYLDIISNRLDAVEARVKVDLSRLPRSSSIIDEDEGN